MAQAAVCCRSLKTPPAGKLFRAGVLFIFHTITFIHPVPSISGCCRGNNRTSPQRSIEFISSSSSSASFSIAAVMMLSSTNDVAPSEPTNKHRTWHFPLIFISSPFQNVIYQVWYIISSYHLLPTWDNEYNLEKIITQRWEGSNYCFITSQRNLPANDDIQMNLQFLFSLFPAFNLGFNEKSELRWYHLETCWF